MARRCAWGDVDQSRAGRDRSRDNRIRDNQSFHRRLSELAGRSHRDHDGLAGRAGRSRLIGQAETRDLAARRGRVRPGHCHLGSFRRAAVAARPSAAGCGRLALAQCHRTPNLVRRRHGIGRPDQTTNCGDRHRYGTGAILPAEIDQTRPDPRIAVCDGRGRLSRIQPDPVWLMEPNSCLRGSRRVCRRLWDHRPCTKHRRILRRAFAWDPHLVTVDSRRSVRCVPGSDTSCPSGSPTHRWWQRFTSCSIRCSRSPPGRSSSTTGISSRR